MKKADKTETVDSDWTPELIELKKTTIRTIIVLRTRRTISQ